MDARTVMLFRNPPYQRGPPRDGLSKASQAEEEETDPFALWSRWYGQALASTDKWAHNMVLSTCGADMQPRSRNVTLHTWDERGFVFCTNSEGEKARQMKENPRVAACFSWPSLDRQVRITGVVEQLSDGETEVLFRHCSPMEQAGFYTTSQGKDHPHNQSNPELDRQERLQYMRETYERFGLLEDCNNGLEGNEHERKRMQELVPLPPAWKGFRIRPTSLEFFFGDEPGVRRMRFTLSTTPPGDNNNRIDDNKKDKKNEENNNNSSVCNDGGDELPSSTMEEESKWWRVEFLAP
ncbi:pyridoxal 5'-phosphate synthase [Balamuthia mandrillaris]